MLTVTWQQLLDNSANTTALAPLQQFTRYHVFPARWAYSRLPDSTW